MNNKVLRRSSNSSDKPFNNCSMIRLLTNTYTSANGTKINGPYLCWGEGKTYQRRWCPKYLEKWAPQIKEDITYNGTTSLIGREGEREGSRSLIAFRCFNLVLKMILSRIAPGNTFTTWKDRSAPLLRIDWRLTRKADGHSEKSLKIRSKSEKMSKKENSKIFLEIESGLCY